MIWYLLTSFPLSWGWPRDSSSQQMKSKSCHRPYWRPFAFGWKGRCFPSPFPPTLNAAYLSTGSNKEDGGKSKNGQENGPHVVGPLTRVSSCITESGLCLDPHPASRWAADKHIDAHMEYGFERISGESSGARILGECNHHPSPPLSVWTFARNSCALLQMRNTPVWCF